MLTVVAKAKPRGGEIISRAFTMATVHAGRASALGRPARQFDAPDQPRWPIRTDTPAIRPKVFRAGRRMGRHAPPHRGSGTFAAYAGGAA